MKISLTLSLVILSLNLVGCDDSNKTDLSEIRELDNQLFRERMAQYNLCLEAATNMSSVTPDLAARGAAYYSIKVASLSMYRKCDLSEEIVMAGSCVIADNLRKEKGDLNAKEFNGVLKDLCFDDLKKAPEGFLSSDSFQKCLVSYAEYDKAFVSPIVKDRRALFLGDGDPESARQFYVSNCGYE
ncbi:hypothetical protein [Oceanobacter mangrovi]|uniref:hypothetical protein n=1 Tax=Oceanobacter mangrovi TaxID=2862510 RepID=UPI001C8DD33F|nr:hypothetical protein [Oceanobacter mangrovi]